MGQVSADSPEYDFMASGDADRLQAPSPEPEPQAQSPEPPRTGKIKKKKVIKKKGSRDPEPDLFETKPLLSEDPMPMTLMVTNTISGSSGRQESPEVPAPEEPEEFTMEPSSDELLRLRKQRS